MAIPKRPDVAESAVKAKDIEEGEAPSTTKKVSKWYLHVCQFGDCAPRWSEFEHHDDDHLALAGRTAHAPIVHRFTNDAGKWFTDSITIQEPLMKKVLDRVLRDYQDLDLHVENYTFKPPFMPLCHRWQVLKQYEDNVADPELKRTATELLEYLTPILELSVKSAAQTLRTGKVAFDCIWQIFAPKTLVSTSFYNVQTSGSVTKYTKVEKTREIPAHWIITIRYVDWNGETAGFATTNITIWEYEGHRRVTSLPVYPITFLADEASYKSQMIQRGRIFERLRGYHYMVANGIKLSLEEEQRIQRPIAGKVCVDAFAYYASCNKVKAALELFRPDDSESDEGSDDEGDDASQYSEPLVCSYDSELKAKLKSEFNNVQVEEGANAKGMVRPNENLEPLTDEQCLLATPWVKAFDLKTKQWCEVRVDELQAMAWNDEAFEKLVLPGDEKQLAWDFVEAKTLAQSNDFDDFIPDKGRGLIILMFGPPGVGKTLTSEAVAEKARVPLYAVSAADLGTAPEVVEKSLQRALDLCRTWNAMLLLDEADVFLGARTPESVARNELVAVFLRTLEFYQGVMFLTTNRVASIDVAFQSRIDLFLPYYDLAPAARREVWVNFMDRVGKAHFEVEDDEVLDRLAQLPLNGREIKNLVKSAQLLSLKSGSKVPLDRIYMLAERRVQALAAVKEDGQ